MEGENDYPYRLGQAKALLKMCHETLDETKVYPGSLKEAVEEFLAKEANSE